MWATLDGISKGRFDVACIRELAIYIFFSRDFIPLPDATSDSAIGQGGPVGERGGVWGDEVEQ